VDTPERARVRAVCVCAQVYVMCVYMMSLLACVHACVRARAYLCQVDGVRWTLASRLRNTEEAYERYPRTHAHARAHTH
jgi:hypothetical protein